MINFKFASCAWHHNTFTALLCRTSNSSDTSALAANLHHCVYMQCLLTMTLFILLPVAHLFALPGRYGSTVVSLLKSLSFSCFLSSFLACNFCWRTCCWYSWFLCHSVLCSYISHCVCVCVLRAYVCVCVVCVCVSITLLAFWSTS